MRFPCISILKKETYFVRSDGSLGGYRWINFPMRVWLSLKNWHSGGKIEQETVKKINEVFTFILNINTQSSISLDAEYDKTFDNTQFTLTEKHRMCYTSLAHRVLARYSKEKHPELFTLAHRILHERDSWITVPATINSPIGLTTRNTEVPNAKKFIPKGSSWEVTTVWGPPETITVPDFSYC